MMERAVNMGCCDLDKKKNKKKITSRNNACRPSKAET
jgi:hypothetical protein